MEPHQNLKSLDARDDETPQANPRPRLPGWARFTSGVSSRKKTISLIETLTPWVILSSFDGSAGDEGHGPKDEFLKMKKDLKALGVSLLGLSHKNLVNEKHSFIFGIRKAWFWIPTSLLIQLHKWCTLCLAHKLNRNFLKYSYNIIQFPLH
jgi:hypothetical protein